MLPLRYNSGKRKIPDVFEVNVNAFGQSTLFSELSWSRRLISRTRTVRKLLGTISGLLPLPLVACACSKGKEEPPVGLVRVQFGFITWLAD